MIVSFDLAGDKLAHMQPSQFGAFVQYCFQMKNIHSVEVFAQTALNRPRIRVSFELGGGAQVVDQVKIESRLKETAEALANMEPFPCTCGCGAFIAISACFRQSGVLDDENLSNPYH